MWKTIYFLQEQFINRTWLMIWVFIIHLFETSDVYLETKKFRQIFGS